MSSLYALSRYIYISRDILFHTSVIARAVLSVTLCMKSCLCDWLVNQRVIGSVHVSQTAKRFVLLPYHTLHIPSHVFVPRFTSCILMTILLLTGFSLAAAFCLQIKSGAAEGSCSYPVVKFDYFVTSLKSTEVKLRFFKLYLNRF
jgi:hypothetical protein